VVADCIGDLFDFMVANPDVLRLVQHETAHFVATESPHREARAAHYADKVAAVSAAQHAGAIDPGLDPHFVVLGLIGQVSWFVAAPQITEMLLAKKVDPAVQAQYRAHLITMTNRMLDIAPHFRTKPRPRQETPCASWEFKRHSWR
jgi:hypothetical protein